MKKICLIILISLLVPAGILRSEDYQLQYFKDKKKHLPFSDYIPKIRLHYKTVPHYLEDYYELYGMKEYYNENSLRMNIQRLKTGLESKFRHPSEALVPTENDEEYQKYRNLLFMHLNLLIMRNTMTIAARYNLHKIKFYSRDFAKEISESMDIAKRTYEEAIPYWKEAVKYAKNASKIKITTGLGFIESERYSIVNNELDFDRIIRGHMKKIDEKKKKLEKAVATTK